MQNILLRWQYNSGQWYEFWSDSSAQVGQLYRLKVLENLVTKVQVIKNEVVVIEWAGDEL